MPLSVDSKTPRPRILNPPLDERPRSSTPLRLTREQTRLGAEEFFTKILRLFKRKAREYSTEEDGLHLLRESSRRLGIPLPQVILPLLEKHLVALEGATRQDELVLGEGVEDRLFDISAYCALLYLALREKDIVKRREAR